MKKAWFLALVVLFSPLAAGAGSRAEALKQVESSMLVKGSIETDADGSVSNVTIDKAEKFPAGLVDYVRKQVMGWKFEPVLVDGKPMRARSLMSVRVVAKRAGEDSYSITVRNASFDGEAPAEGETLTSRTMRAPGYPPVVAAAGASGVVYVVVKVGANGRVADAIVEQVNLKTAGTDNEMARWRKSLADVALGAARRWTFNTPVKGEQARQESWSARVPVAFHMNSSLDTAYGKWEMYIPGPRQPVPWSAEDHPGFSPDALAEGGVYMIGRGGALRLLTELDGT